MKPLIKPSIVIMASISLFVGLSGCVWQPEKNIRQQQRQLAKQYQANVSNGKASQNFTVSLKGNQATFTPENNQASFAVFLSNICPALGAVSGQQNKALLQADDSLLTVFVNDFDRQPFYAKELAVESLKSKSETTKLEAKIPVSCSTSSNTIIISLTPEK